MLPPPVINSLWQKLSGTDKSFTLSELADMVIADNDACMFALFLNLRNHSSLFSIKHGLYKARSPEEHMQYEQIRLQQEADAAYTSEVEDWIKQLLKSEQKDFVPPLPVLGHDARLRLKDELTGYYYERLPAFLLKAGRSLCPQKTHLDLALLVRKGLGQYDESCNTLLTCSGLPCLYTENLTVLADALPEFTTGAFCTDLSHLTCFTIDDPESEDLDDSISLEPMPGGWMLGIHISDVDHFIEKDSPLDREAYLRTSSIYLPDGDVHMLPPVIACQKASLRLGQTRPALSALVKFDGDFHVVSHQLLLSSIRVSKCFSYEETEVLLRGDDESERSFDALFQNLRALTDKNIALRQQNGAVIIPDEESQKPARRLVAECMVIYNSLIAETAAFGKLPFLFRYLEKPFLANDEEDYIPPSVLGTSPHEHKAMGLPVYAQATSPLRRYADLVNQRQLKAYLKGESPPYTGDELEGMLEHLSRVRQIIRRINRAQASQDNRQVLPV